MKATIKMTSNKAAERALDKAAQQKGVGLRKGDGRTKRRGVLSNAQRLSSSSGPGSIWGLGLDEMP